MQRKQRTWIRVHKRSPYRPRLHSTLFNVFTSGVGTNLKVGALRKWGGGTDPARIAGKKLFGRAPPLFWL